MRYKNRFLYYATVVIAAVLLGFAPKSSAVGILQGGMLVFLPLAITYWLFNEVLLGRWLARQRTRDSTIVKGSIVIACLGITAIIYGMSNGDLLAAHLGVAVVLVAGEGYVTRREYPLLQEA